MDEQCQEKQCEKSAHDDKPTKYKPSTSANENSSIERTKNQQRTRKGKEIVQTLRTHPSIGYS